jgi:hypothetical protein
MAYFVSCVGRGVSRAVHEIFWVSRVGFFVFIVVWSGVRAAHAARYPAARPFGDTSYLTVSAPSSTAPNFATPR